MPREAMLYDTEEDGVVHCYLCNHHCKIKEGNYGFCGVRQNIEGKLHTHAYGKAIAAHVDPIEKKPLYHFLPGTQSFSIAGAGCNFRCGFCQNWQISQVSRTGHEEMSGQALSPKAIVNRAKEQGCKSISYTYTEPTIFFEYAYETARLAKDGGLYNVFVTNGYMTPDALEKIEPYLDACNVDLKSFREEFYWSTCKGHLDPVLESIHTMRRMGIWVEITTLIVPDQNDSEEELGDIIRFIAGMGSDIPWHISRFHPDYQLQDVETTPMETLMTAQRLGREAGLQYIYMGNVPRASTETTCPTCQNLLIRRWGFTVERNVIRDGHCPYCGEVIAGLFAYTKNNKKQ